jgi:type I restriction enzyme S subunit
LPEGYTRPTTFGGRNYRKNFTLFDDQGEYSWVRISDVTASNKYLEISEQKLSEFGKSKCVSLEPGELFISICASVGK